MSHIFFFSYAHDDQRNAPLIRQFFDDLRAEVAQAMAISADEAGVPLDERIAFLDREVLQLGTAWPEALASALQNTPVLVSMYSPTYFNRPYCGKEMQVFLTRQSQHAKKHGRQAPAILPLIWYPFDAIPPGVSHLDLEDDSFGDAYRKGGINVLKRMNEHHDAYQRCLTVLAQRIKAAAKHALDPLETPPILADVENVFEKASPVPQRVSDARRAGPATVGLLYVAGTRDEFQKARINVDLGRYGDEGWQWIAYDAQPIGNMAIDIARAKGFHPREFEVGDPLLPKLENAESKNSPVMLIVDARTLRVELHRKRMSDYDKSNLLNCAAVVLWDEHTTPAERAELQNLAKQVFKGNYKTRQPAGFFRPTVECSTHLHEQMGEALNTVQLNLLSNGEPQRDMGPGKPPPTL